MKKYIFVAMAAFCSDLKLTDSVTDVKSTELVQTSDVNDKAKVDDTIEKAKWGDGQAFLQLADCSRNGIGVKKDLFDENKSLSEIPKRMPALDDVHSLLMTFNYKNFYYYK